MGVVYLALAQGHAGFQKLKVVKRLRADLAADPKSLEMFLDEARLAARLQHPNIVQTNEVGFDGKHYFLEMEYLEGQSYDALVRHAKRNAEVGRVPLDVSCWILAEVLAGLEHAHELVDLSGKRLEIVHRDVSPHNVMVTYDGTVKLLDFGIAKAADSQSETQTGAVKGKVTYMAPEQATRKPTDRRADLFAVGVMLWQALTGERMWGDANDFEIFIKLQGTDKVPNARSVSPEAPAELDEIASRALSFNREERYATAADMRAAIDTWLSGRPNANGRAAAALMDKLFADQRKAVRAEIEAQIKQPQMGMTAADVPVLGEGAATRSGSDTGNAEIGQTGNTQVPTGIRQRTEIRGLRGIAIGAIAIALAASAAAVLSARARRLNAANADASALTIAAKPPGCTTNVECTQKSGGKAAICNHASGSCAVLEQDGCKILAEPGDVENDRTIWIGAMFPLTGPRADNGGVEDMRAVDLGRRDFAQITRGIPRSDGTRPLAVLSCDDADGGEMAARHLVSVGVPAVIGFGSSQEIIDLAPKVFLPAHVMAVPSFNNSPLITKIPHAQGDPRLIFRTCANSVQLVVPLALLVSQELEPRIRASDGSAGEVVRVALVRPKTTMGLGFEDAIFSSLRFNGKSVIDNGANYRGVPIPEQNKAPSEVDYAEARKSVIELRPQVVFFVGEDELTEPFLKPLEKEWPRGVRRPYYVSPTSFGGNPNLMSWLAKNAELRRRFFEASPPSNSPANVRFTSRFNETFPEKVTEDLSPAAPYDAFYLLAYAIAITDDLSAGGRGIAKSIARLLPPGPVIEVGPSQIFDAFSVLQKGNNIDLNGAGSPLDFDLESGESFMNYTIECVSVGGIGSPARVVSSGLAFSASSKKLTGAFRCP